MPSRKFIGCLVGCVAFTIFGFLAFACLVITPNFKATGEIPRVQVAMVTLSKHYLLLLSAEIIYILLYLIQYIRYLEVKEYFMINQERFMSVINKVAFVTGFLLVIGFKIFTQYEFKEVDYRFKEHINIVLLAFFVLYCILQTMISCRMVPRIIGYFTLFLRMLTIFFYLTLIVVNLQPEVNGKLYTVFKNLDISPGMSYTLFKDNCQATSEWLAVVTYWMYLITYVADFDKMAISPPKIYINYVSHMEYLKNTLQF